MQNKVNHTSIQSQDATSPIIATASSEPPQVLTVDEVAELLRLNRKTVYEAISKGEIPRCREDRSED